MGQKAYKEACKFGDIKVLASSEADTFTWIPKFGRDDIRSDADYVYITTNNTIYGTAYNYVPDTGTSSGGRHVVQHPFPESGCEQVRRDLGRGPEKCGACGSDHSHHQKT